MRLMLIEDNLCLWLDGLHLSYRKLTNCPHGCAGVNHAGSKRQTHAQIHVHLLNSCFDPPCVLCLSILQWITWHLESAFSCTVHLNAILYLRGVFYRQHCAAGAKVWAHVTNNVQKDKWTWGLDQGKEASLWEVRCSRIWMELGYPECRR